MGMMKYRTVEKDSFFTRLDFRPKLLMIVIVSVVAFLWESPLLGAALGVFLIVSCLLAGLKVSYIRTLLLVMLPFYVLLLVAHGIFDEELVLNYLGQERLHYMFRFPGGGELFGAAGMSWEGFWYGVNIIFKTLSLTLVIPLGIFTTDVDRMIVGMVKSRIPYKITFIFSSTLRFFPLLFEEIGAIIQAQRLRGLAVEDMNAVRKVKVYAKVAIPLILSAMVKSQQLEVVLQSKAFSGSPDRTYLHSSDLTRTDYLLGGIFLLLFALVLVLYFLYGVGKYSVPFIAWEA